MSEEKKTMPMGQAGLVRYFDDYKPKVQISPRAVIAGVSMLIILEIFMKFLLV
jgi:preprotein translocase subunit Sec61beta